MRFHRFDLNLLVALDTLLTERNVTRAAQRLNIGQSAASASLARLREYFQDDLLVASGRELRLSALGLTLVEPVRATLRQAQATLQLQPGFDPASSERHFAMETSDYVIQALGADLVRRVGQAAPRMRLSLLRRTPDTLERLDRGLIDLLLVPDFYPASPHPSEPVFEDRYVCLAWREHPALGERLDKSAYFSLGHVASRQRDTRPYAFEDAHLPKGWPERRIEVFVDDFVSLPELVIGTERIATVQRRIAERALAQGLPVRLWPLPFNMPPLRQTVRWHATAHADPALRWLREQVRAAAGG